MRSVKLNAYAKINLTLDIIGIREDGYHTVDMVMQSISLCDVVTVTLNNTGGVTLACSKPGIPLDMRNTAYKAARYFLDASGIGLGVDIHIEKHIPDQAGMGGGSADAAAVLCALDRLCEDELGEYPLNTADLLYIGTQIGADVPFCILNGTRRCCGIGEMMVPLADMPKCGLVIIKPEVGVSTPEAYKRCDTVPDTGIRYTKEMIRAIEGHDLEAIAKGLGNRFDDALCLPEVQAAKKALIESGAMNAIMTGSGSAIFGIFETLEQARSAADRLGEAYDKIFTAVPITAQESKITSA